MGNYTPSITLDDIYNALGDFIQNFVGDAPVVRGQTNRVSMPQAPFVLMTELRNADLQVPHVDYDFSIGADSAQIQNAQSFDIQVDFYASNAGDLCSTVMVALRSSWGWDQFPEGIRPLYTADGIQAPLISGEQQYENRWILTTSLQYNPALTVPQQYASNASAATYQADR